MSTVCNTKKLGDVCDFIGGGTPPKSNNLYYQGHILWATVRDMNFDVISNTEFKITEEALRNSTSNIIPKKSVVIASRVGLGKVCILEKDTAINQDLRAVIPKEPGLLSEKYLFWWFKSIADLIIRNGRGATVKGVTLPFLKNLEIPIPLLAEQSNIVSVLDHADALRQKRKEAMKLLDEYVQSVFFEMFGDPAANSKGWDRPQVKDFAEVKMGPFGSLLHKQDYVRDGIPLVNPKHILDKKIVTDPECSISSSKAQELEQYRLQTGDVILGRRGEIGRCGVVTMKENGFLCGTGSMFIRPTISVNPTFLVYLISTPQITKELENKAVGITMKNLSATIVNRWTLPIPPLEKQLSFSEIVSNVSKLKEQMLSQSYELEAQFNALMQKAFIGNL